MKILRHGKIFTFRCDACGCVFVEASSKTNFGNAAIWVPEKNTHGARMTCPECGYDNVIGVQEDAVKRGKEDA